MSHKSPTRLLLLVVCAMATGQVVWSQRVAAQQATAGSASGLEVVRLQPDFYMIAGAGGNIAVHIGY